MAFRAVDHPLVTASLCPQYKSSKVADVVAQTSLGRSTAVALCVDTISSIARGESTPVAIMISAPKPFSS
ncbi:hypothetical protein EXIGLDRAFT_758803 [Exidia glandulosa HHB12029]|uniref:Uncharacterized protein n=1 Tax=Exidia glandulosa HHB12029 TaxID=1314781 RepID=A0A165QDH1_EXIGL|nr:hypothetical protein EXIGLDRAFT_758803 [Exidia glandulosa HHB12029]